MKKIFTILVAILFTGLITKAQPISTSGDYLVWEQEQNLSVFNADSNKNILQGQMLLKGYVPKVVNVNPGGLLLALGTDLKTVTDLTVTGKIDARDFKTIRDSMPVLTQLDLSNASVAAYTGKEGTDTSSTENLVNAIPKNAFYISTGNGCRLTSVIMPSTITSIGVNAFNRCRDLTAIAIPNSVTSINNYAFANTGLISINIPPQVSSIASNAFLCNNLKSITVDIANAKFTAEDDILFNKKKNKILRCPTAKSGNYAIPVSVDSIGDLAFYGNKALTLLTMPYSVVSIENQSFSYISCAIIVDDANPKFCSKDSVFYDKNQTTLIRCPKYKKGTFTIPSSVNSIGSFAFADCNNLTSVIIPVTVTSIGNYAFQMCSGLKSIYAYPSKPVNVASSVFDNATKSTCTLYVSKGTKAAYASASVWKDFTNIVETLMVGITETAEENFIAMYPNPVTDILNIESHNNDLFSVEILNLDGSITLKKEKLTQKAQLDLQGLNSGSYFIRVYDKNYGTTQKILIK